MKKIIFCCLFIFLPFFLFAKNGFIIDKPLVPSEEILVGGPPKDGIPAILKPKFISSKKTKLTEEDRILGVFFNGIAKAYPIRILNWHELVNDEIQGKKFVVSYCPLCGTGVIFASELGEDLFSFGVSGLLYNSDVLLYDHQTESLWSQLLGKSISGKHKGKKLTILVSENTTWRKWKKEYPRGLVLSEETGYNRDYDRDPYAGYEKSRTIYFRVSQKAPEIYHPKEMVLGVEIEGRFKAYPFIELSKQGKKTFVDKWNKKELIVHWDEKNRTAKITDKKENTIPTIQSFWFAWFTFYPRTDIFSP